MELHSAGHRRGVVAAPHHAAAEAGRAILAEGGNALEAMVAMAATIVKHKLDYWTGTVYTTNRRVWEHDQAFKDYLTNVRVLGIDMETATIFIVGFANHIPKGALLLVSDNPMTPEGVKTSRSDKSVNEKFVRAHLEVGIDSLVELRDSGESVEHLRFE